jgi:hypothetical protein
MKKNPVNKNQGWNPSINSTRQKRAQQDTTQRKKQKQTINQNQVMTYSWLQNDNQQ